MKDFLLFILMFLLYGCNEGSLLPNVTKDCGNFDLTLSDGSTGDFYYITDVRIIPLDKELIGSTTNWFRCKTLENQVVFEVRTKYIRLTSDQLKNITKIKIEANIVNPIKWFNAPFTSFKFSNDIYYKGTLIPAYTNILNVANIEVPEFYFPLIVSPYTISTINMYREYFHIPNGKYKVMASWETYDDKIIQDTVDVIISLK